MLGGSSSAAPSTPLQPRQYRLSPHSSLPSVASTSSTSTLESDIEILSLRSQLQKLRNDQFAAQQEVAQMRKERAEEQAEVKALAASYESAVEQAQAQHAAALRAVQQRQQVQLTALQEQLKAQAQANRMELQCHEAALEAQADAHNAKLLLTKAGHAKEVDAMQQEVAAKEQQAIRLQETIDAMAKADEENATLKEQLSMLRQSHNLSMKRLQLHFSQQNEDMHSLQTQRTELAEQLAAMKKAMEARQAEVEEVTQEAAALSQEVKSLHTRLELQEGHHSDQLQQISDHHAAELRELKQSTLADKGKASSSSSSNSIAEKTTELAAELTEVVLQLQQYKARNADLKHERDKLRGMVELFKKTISKEMLFQMQRRQELGTSSPPDRSSSRPHRTTSKLTAEALAQQQQQQQQRRSKLKGQQSGPW